MISLNIEPDQYIYGEGPGLDPLWIEAAREGDVFKVLSFDPDTDVKPVEGALGSFKEALHAVHTFLGL